MPLHMWDNVIAARPRFLAAILAPAAACLVAAAGFSTRAHAQTRFDRFYDSLPGSNERASSVEQTTDRGYIFVGRRDVSPASSAIYAVRADHFGNVVWAMSYGAPGAALRVYGSCVRQTRDGGFIIAGVANGALAPNQIILIKTDPAGNITWQRAYRGGNNDADPLRGPVVRERSGAAGGYVVVSNVYVPQLGNLNAGILLRTDAAGNPIDENYYLDPRYPGQSSTAFHDVRQDANGSFIITGTTYAPNGGSEALVVKTLPNSPAIGGARVYGPPSDLIEGESLEITSGGGYAFVGHRAAPNTTVLFKTSPALAPIFNLQFNGLDTAYSLREDAFYNLVSTGVSPNIALPMFNASTLMRNALNGAFQWAGQYPFGGQKDAAQGVPTSDGGYVLAGATALGPNPFNLSAIKTDALGRDCDRNPLNPMQPQWQPQITPIDLVPVPIDGFIDLQLIAAPDQPRTDWTCLVPGCTPPPQNMVFWSPFDAPLPFRDLAGGGNGTSVGGPALTPGYVNQSFCFNSGATPYIDFPNSASKNFNLGSFSFDAWVRRPNTGGAPLNDGVRVIVDKRTQLPNGDIRGYSFYLFNGSLACQVGTGAFVNYGSGAAGLIAPDGQWHHVAVTIDRLGAPPQILFYVDGAQAGPGVPVNPANLGLSVNCPSALRIGARIAAGPVAGSTFQDCIDEVELFNRVLRADEILSLFQAQSAGKCREFCHVPVATMCPGDTSVTVNVTLCNDTTTPQTYTYGVQGLPVGPGCQIAGPSFTPTTYAPVTINPGVCVPVSITIPRPVGLGNSLAAGWQICFQSSSGAAFCCTGRIVGASYLCIADPTGGVFSTDLVVGAPVHITLSAANDAPDSLRTPLRLRVLGPDMENDDHAVSLNGLPPGEPVFGTLDIVGGGHADIDFTAEIIEGGQDSIYRAFTVLVEADLDADGEFEPIAGFELNDITPPPPTPCRADFNDDGAVNSQDFFDFLSAFFALEPTADINSDGSINSQDFFDFVTLFFTGC